MHVKNLNTGNHTIVLIHENAALAGRTGWWGSCSRCNLTEVRQPEFPHTQWMNEVLKNKVKKNKIDCNSKEAVAVAVAVVGLMGAGVGLGEVGS